MRLLHTRTRKVEEFGGNKTPPYAILSHTWGVEEVTLQDIKTDKAIKLMGYEKVKNACSLAAKDGFEYVWIDTCCIDKTSSAELSEALNSMYRWYEEAGECYAYLADVPRGTVNRLTGAAGEAFQKSRWFTRGWTLQELVAPPTIIFLDSEWQEMGSKSSLHQLITKITGIPGGFLFGDDLGHASVAQRMSWAAKRETTRIEDVAYCLMGIFGIYMPMLYGEGERAFIRLQEEIIRVSDDHSLFAWRSTDDRGGILATSPSAFTNSGNIVPTKSSNVISSPPTLSSRGIGLSLQFRNNAQQSSGLAILNCTEEGKENMRVAIHLRDIFLTKQDFAREQSSTFELLDMDKNPSQTVPRIYVRQWRSTRNRKWEEIEKCAIKLEGVSREVATSHTTYLHENWKWHDGQMVTTTKLPPNGILGRLLFICKDGNSFQVVLKKRGSILSADIHTSFEADDKLNQSPLIPEQQEHERDRIISVLSDGHHVHVAIKRRILMLDEGKHLTGVMEISYSSTPLGMWLQHIAVFEGDIKEKTLLLYAARRGHETVVKLLLDTKKVDINSEEKDGMTPLAWAAGNGHEAVVKLLIESGAELETKDTAGQTPLSWAAEKGHEAVVKLLLDRGTKIETKDQMPLSWPTRYRNKLLLLKKGAAVDSKDIYNRTPLMYAAQGGHEAVVKLLLEKGAAVDSKDRGNDTPLSHAVQKGHVAVVRRLLEKGAVVDWKGGDGRTPLSYAARGGHEAVVRLLLEKGAVVDLRDSPNRTPLSYAAGGGHEAVVRLLLKKGAVVDSRDSPNRTPLSYAAGGGHEAVVRLLLKKGAAVDSRNTYNQTPLSYAARGGHEAVVRLLLEKGAAVDSRNNPNQTPLSYAAQGGHEAVVRLLLEKGAAVDSKDRDGWTPLSYAAQYRNMAVVRLLLEKGTLVDLAAGDVRELLSYAAKNGHEAIVRLLLEKGAVVDSKDTRIPGTTAHAKNTLRHRKPVK